MKGFYSIAVAMVLALGIVGCTKDEAPAKKDIKVSFSVTSKDGFDSTRAVKSDWAVDDQILVLFKVGENWPTQMENAFTLTYAGNGKWNGTRSGTWSDELIGSQGGEFFAIHYRGDIELNDGSFNYTAGELLRMEGGQYSVEDDGMDLGTLTLKLRDDAVQFSVQDLATNKDSWTLAVYYDETRLDYSYDGDCVVLGTNYVGCVTFSDGKMGLLDDYNNMYYVDINGVVNGNDLSFFSHFDQDHTLENFKKSKTYFFTLFNSDEETAYVFKYNPTPFELLTKGAYLLPPLTFEADGVTPVEGCLWEKLW